MFDCFCFLFSSRLFYAYFFASIDVRVLRALVVCVCRGNELINLFSCAPQNAMHFCNADAEIYKLKVIFLIRHEPNFNHIFLEQYQAQTIANRHFGPVIKRFLFLVCSIKHSSKHTGLNTVGEDGRCDKYSHMLI